MLPFKRLALVSGMLAVELLPDPADSVACARAAASIWLLDLGLRMPAMRYTIPDGAAEPEAAVTVADTVMGVVTVEEVALEVAAMVVAVPLAAAPTVYPKVVLVAL